MRPDSVHKVLMVVALTYTLLCLVLPLPANLTEPGFSSYILFEDPWFLTLYSLSLVSMGLLWYLSMEDRLASTLVVLLFSLLTINLWEAKAPGGSFLIRSLPYGPGDTINAASLTSNILESGHLVLNQYGVYPATYLIGSSFAYTSGVPLVSSIALLDTLFSMLIGLLSFLIIDSFSKSHGLSAAVTMLSIIADEVLFKQPPYTQYDFGVLAFFLMSILIVRSLLKDVRSNRHGLPLAIIYLASVFTYAITPFVVVIMAILSKLTRSGYSLSSKTIAFTLVSFAAWSAYVSLPLLLAFAQNLLRFLGVSKGTPLPGAHHMFGYYLLQLLSTNIASLPYNLGYLLPAWFLVFFGVGTVIWLVVKTMHIPVNVAPAFIMGGLLLTAVIVLLTGYPTGTAWPRVLVYMAPFTGVTVLGILGHRRRLYVTVVVAVVLLLTLPTIIAYTPTVGDSYANYAWEISAGNYLSTRMTGGVVYFAIGILTLNFSFNSKLIPALPAEGGLTPVEGQAVIYGEIKDFKLSTDGSVLAISSLLEANYAHLYGNTLLGNLTTDIERTTAASNLVYSNGFLFVLGQ
jgi:hypothetical protein